MRPHTTHSRDSALRRLSLSTRWMIAGSVALTGALSEVAAQAFPGKTLKTGGAHTSRAAKSAARKSHAQSSPSSLAAPQEAPEHTTEQQATPERSEATPETHAEATPETQREATPEAQPEAAPEASSEPAPEVRSEVTPETSVPAQAAPETPVVSGGS